MRVSLPPPALTLFVLPLACWAPEVVPDTPEPAAVAAPVHVDPSLPSPPFTAWTVTAPLTLVGPGGVTVAQLTRSGVEVEVLQVLPARLRVRCTGCTGEQAEAEGWLQQGTISVERPPVTGGAAAGG